MTSSTDDMSTEETELKTEWWKELGNDVDAETTDEIEFMLESVPQLKQYFNVINKIGSGTFSSVYVACLKNQPDIQQLFALKYIIPTSHPSRIENELKCLREIGGTDNVMGVKCCVRQRDHVVIIMPYFPHEKFMDYVCGGLSVAEVRRYMYNLLTALQHVHSCNFIHRDVKPSNFLFNRKLNQYALVDFGLAQKCEAERSDTKTCDQRKTRSRSLDEVKVSPRKRKFAPATSVAASGSTAKSPDASLKEIQNVPEEEPQKTRQSASKELRDAVTKENAKDGTTKENVSAASRSTRQHIKKIHSPRRNCLEKRAQQKIRGDMKVTPPSGQNIKHTTMVLKQDGKKFYKSVAPSACGCFGKLMICSVCNSRSGQQAPRAGTPGFRAPEVLLKYPHQTTAVDVWSAGVIFLSLLSWRYPFFKAPDDINALAQIMSVFGSKAMQKSAKAYGKNVVAAKEFPEIDVKFLCEKLRKNTLVSSKVFTKIAKDKDLNMVPSKKGDTGCEADMLQNGRTLRAVGKWDSVPESAYDLLRVLLDLNPVTRVSAKEALKHEFFMLSEL